MNTLKLQPISPTSDHIGFLDGLRGLAALAVVIGHCMQVTVEMRGFRALWYTPIFQYWASASVPAFMVLSGYCLALPVARTGVLRGGAWEFFVRRSRRILPLYLVTFCAALAVAFWVTKTMSVYSVFTPEVLYPLFLLHDVFVTNVPFDRPMWSLPIEWHAYLLFPVLAWAWSRWGITRPTIAAVGVILAAFFVTTGTTYSAIRPDFYLLFIAGMVAAQVTSSPSYGARGIRDWPHWEFTRNVFAIAFAGIMFIPARQYDAQQAVQIGLAGAATLCAIVAMQNPTDPLRSWLSKPWIVGIGTSSYSLYLWHFILLNVIAAYLPMRAANPLLFPAVLGITLPLSLAVAWASYKLIESPFMRKRSSAMARMDQPLPS